MLDKPRYAFHYTPSSYFERFGPGEDYTPPEYAEEGFIHTTDGAENMAKVANWIYKDDQREFTVLYIDKELVKSPIRYDDPDEIYPHIYGPLNLDAVVETRPALREPDGTFLPMPEL
jgi:uncharacterized protein (DUF952 family)